MNRQSRKSGATARRHLVYVQQRRRTPDGSGGFSDGWTNRTTDRIWAAVDPIQARARDQYKTSDVEATHLITVDAYTTIEETDRVLFDGRFFDVLTVENLQERDFVKVATCSEIRPSRMS